MELIISLLSLILFVVLVAGLIRPAWVFRSGDQTRKRVLKVYGLGYLAFCVTAAYIMPSTNANDEIAEQSRPVSKPKEYEYSGQTLAEWRDASKSDRDEMVSDFVSAKSLPDSASDLFYRCLSQMSMTKSDELTVGQVLGWCQVDYDKDPAKLSSMVNFDNFKGQFSAWDGSHRNLEKYIKSMMNDEDSYEHVETRYRLVLDQNPRAIVTTVFKGKNAYGGVVKQSVSAAVDIETGRIIEIIQ
ncbi:ORF47 [Vibrio phage VHML]|uniref:ORF47 n=1 Tax=Vibrio phage VHML TaxID=207597 RepID=Q8H9M0_9CAUD|nr:ORF47 [Vibrio phage VHML]AAN12346.1 ORF47 [Vibrio phage VHML]